MDESTVYIIGAGASKEVNLPTGEELKGKIASLLNFKYDRGMMVKGCDVIYESLSRYMPIFPQNLTGKYLKECNYIYQNMPLAQSIDNFIDINRENKELEICAKLAIVRSILNAENESLLFIDYTKGHDALDFNMLSNTWYLHFFRTITEQCRLEDLEKRLSKIALIIFNYDRCVEHFLFNAFKSYYRVNDNVAASLINKMTIYHPYGAIGRLTWQPQGDTPLIAFGGNLTANKLVEHAKEIKTFTQQEKIENETVRQLLDYSERYVFLGFAFHQLNIQLLFRNIDIQVREVIRNRLVDAKKGQRCFATTLGMSKSDQNRINKFLVGIFGKTADISIENLPCNQLFQDYSHSLGYC